MKRNERCCRRKKRFSNPVSALRAYIDMATTHTQNIFRLYLCPECHGLHIGRATLRMHRKLRSLGNREVILRMARKTSIAKAAV